MIAGITYRQTIKSPIIIIEGIQFYYDYGNKAIVARDTIHRTLADMLIKTNEDCWGWFNKNVEIADAWERRKDKEQDKEGPKLISSKEYLEGEILRKEALDKILGRG